MTDDIKRKHICIYARQAKVCPCCAAHKIENNFVKITFLDQNMETLKTYTRGAM